MLMSSFLSVSVLVQSNNNNNHHHNHNHHGLLSTYNCRNRRHKSTLFSGTGFWYVCHSDLGPNSSGIPLAPIWTLFYSKPESSVHVTEMIIYDLFLFNTRWNNSGHLGELVVYVAFSHVYFRRQKFSFQTYMVRKSAPKTGARKWSQFMGPVSGACVMGN